MLQRALFQTSRMRLLACRAREAARGVSFAGGGGGGGGGGESGVGVVVDAVDAAAAARSMSQASSSSKAKMENPPPSLLWASLESARHDASGNYERPDRVANAVQGLLDAFESDEHLASICKRVDLEKTDADAAADDDKKNDAAAVGTTRDARAAAEAVHSRAYLARLSDLCSRATASETPEGSLRVADEEDDAEFTYVTGSSVDDALGAVGAALRLWGELTCRRSSSSSSSSSSSPTGPRAALALVRPPGHHAGRGGDPSCPADSPAGAPSGFCLVNTAAAVARRIAASSSSLSSCSSSSSSKKKRRKRVLVVDFDVHVGDGTQDIFWGREGEEEAESEAEETEQVCVVDLHECGAWPGGGGIELRGANGRGGGKRPLFGGVSRVVNVPLPTGSGDAAARAAVERVVAPIVRRFRPHAVVASAGFDAHALEPLAGLRWSDSTYEYLGARLVELAREASSGEGDGEKNDENDENGKVLFVLEGGYSREALRSAVASLVRGAATMRVPVPSSAEGEEEEDRLDEASEAMIRAVVEEHGL